MNEEDEIAHLLGGGYPSLGSSTNAPVPRRGVNLAFDRLCDEAIDGDFDGDRETVQEIRRALWATWRTEAPRGMERPARHREEEEDAELARALMESTRESRTGSAQGSRAQSPIAIRDDEDAELLRAIEMSKEEVRAPKRQRRESTPEEERRMLAEAMAASLAQEAIKNASDASHHEDSDDEDLAKANEAFQASRAAFREEETRRRLAIREASDLRSKPPPIHIEQKSSSSRSDRAVLGSGAKSQPAPLSPAPRAALQGILSDRAQMEKERLARQAQKQANLSATTSSNTKDSLSTPISPRTVVTPQRTEGAKVATLNDFRTTALSPKRSAYPGRTVEGITSGVHFASTSRINFDPYHPLQSHPSGRDAAGDYFLDGELRHTTMTIGTPSDAPTFSPEVVIGDKTQIALIIMSSFVIDDEWSDGILPAAHLVPRIVARPHPREMHPQWNGKVQAQDDGEVRCYPQMVGDWGSAHMKYFWIFYKTGRLRVAISTANFVPYDWDFIENTVFVQDFLRKSPHDDTITLAYPLPDFPGQFRYLFGHLKVHKAMRFLTEHHPQGEEIPLLHDDGFASMARWDWSRVKVKIVMSIPGTYNGLDNMDQFGQSRLGKVISDNGWRPKSGEIVRAEYQGSSLGAYTIDWFDTFYQYCSGKTSRDLVNRSKALVFPPMKVIFPSLQTVDASVYGRDGGGTMFRGNAFNSVTKHLFHDANSKRGGVLMHSKVLIAIFSTKENPLGMSASSTVANTSNGKRKAAEMDEGNEGVGGWVYIGSHNFSSAAWGTVNFKKKPPTLNIRNYELGIVFPLPRQHTERAADSIAPHIRPARPYSATDVPWDQTLQAESKAYTL